MSQINPFVGSILQSPQVQRQQAVEKDRLVRRAREAAKNAALLDDQLEHQVESSEELKPIQEDQKHERRFKRSKQHHDADSESKEEEKPRLDLTA